MAFKTDDLRIEQIKELVSPAQVHEQYPITERAAETTARARAVIHEILRGRDDRLLVVIGPCSIHDPQAAREYATRLEAVREALAADLFIVMRVYFEKPRTTVGWKGMINDPDLDSSFHINKGIRLARELLLDFNEMGMPAGTEYLDLITPQYVADLISWGAIGARTTESQCHRELASGLSCPVGFKNGTDGNLKIAIDAIGAARHPHHFLSVTKGGRSAIFATSGNEDCHVILRGGNDTNYDAQSVEAASAELAKADLESRLMIDFSHANSQKQPARQVDVGATVANQIRAGDRRIMGAMIESHLIGGRQDVESGKILTYGQSITDACLGWEESATLLHTLADAVRARRALNTPAAGS
ncbi:MAG: 3-deoxy-7-phosphoheptulonate synthase AroG [Gammaproteobacteria bacterium]|nr:3-deoxy-7-phosphoheptulonate synthase AroG [Gammaproteobacteria bacterium]